jgi:cell division protein FtsL
MGYVSMWELQRGYCWFDRRAGLQAGCRTQQHIPDVLSTFVASKCHFACSAPCSTIFSSQSAFHKLPLHITTRCVSPVALHSRASNSATIATRHLLLMKHKHCASIRHECRDLTAGQPQSIRHERNIQRDWRASLGWERSASSNTRIEEADFSAMYFHPDLSERITNNLETVVR